MKFGIFGGLLSLTVLLSGAAQAQEPLLSCKKFADGGMQSLTVFQGEVPGAGFNLEVGDADGNLESYAIDYDRRIPLKPMLNLNISHYIGKNSSDFKLTVVQTSGYKLLAPLPPLCKLRHCPDKGFPATTLEETYVPFNNTVALLQLGAEEATSEFACY